MSKDPTWEPRRRKYLERHLKSRGNTPISGMVYLNYEPERKSAKANIDEIIYHSAVLGDYGNFGKIKFVLYELLERIEKLENHLSEGSTE